MPQNGDASTYIMDIRRSELGPSVIDDMRNLFTAEVGKKRMPTLLLYDENGLKLFEEITYLEEYYLTRAEIEVLEQYSDDIAASIPEGCRLVELGSGNLRKVKILLSSLEAARKSVEYYALDLLKSELERTLAAIPQQYKYVRCYGLLGTYDDGLAWLKREENQVCPRWVLSLGSSIGNFTRKEASDFLKGFSNMLGDQDRMLIGLDACQDSPKVYRAYNDPQGKTHEFVLNGLLHANRLLGQNVFNLGDWRVFGEYDKAAGRHQAFYYPVKDLFVDGIRVDSGERIRVEESYKYSTKQSAELWENANLMPLACFGNKNDDYHLFVLKNALSPFSLNPKKYAAHPVPSLKDFKDLWAFWDLVTRHMIPEDEILSKPIKLRNCCLFYLGHIPTFLDLTLTRAKQGPATEPSFYQTIFERGIDPDVDNPEKCHAHSEIPETWPPVGQILTYQANVRSRLASLYSADGVPTTPEAGRPLWLSFEHEAMHLETLLYMLLQSDKSIPPSGPAPDFQTLGRKARIQAVPNEWVKIPAQKLTIGMNDPDDDSTPVRYCGWDIEKPQREVSIAAFEAQARPLTNEDYARYLSNTNQDKLPASWLRVNPDAKTAEPRNALNFSDTEKHINGHSEPFTNTFTKSISIKTVYGPVPLEYGLDWPVFASYDELSGCARWMNGRIPTKEEVRSIYSYADRAKAEEAEKVLAKTFSAVNGHLSNDGVEETPPSTPTLSGSPTAELGLNCHDLFVDLDGCNVGFKHFHPTPVTQLGNKLCGQGELGGVWEWTSSVLEEHEGFEAMKLYPGYSADFFDGKHNVVLGGSWATHPRIAGRKSFVNWYQRNYPYAWVGARLVRDESN